MTFLLISRGNQAGGLIDSTDPISTFEYEFVGPVYHGGRSPICFHLILGGGGKNQTLGPTFFILIHAPGLFQDLGSYDFYLVGVSARADLGVNGGVTNSTVQTRVYRQIGQQANKQPSHPLLLPHIPPFPFSPPKKNKTCPCRSSLKPSWGRPSPLTVNPPTLYVEKLSPALCVNYTVITGHLPGYTHPTLFIAHGMSLSCGLCY